MSTMLLSRLHYPVSNLGFGIRGAIWFQGCTVHCRGCVSRDTWPRDESMRVPLDRLSDWMADLPAELDGITVSGGEPTDQPEALARILADVDLLRRSRDRDLDLLVYTGRSRLEAEHRVPSLPEAADALVWGPYERGVPTGDGLIGSANQQVHTYSALGRARYGTWRDEYRHQRERMGVHVDGHAVWLAGIPRDGDMARFRAGLAERGVDLSRTSWLA